MGSNIAIRGMSMAMAGSAIGDACTVRPRVHDGEITYVYSVARH